MNRSELSKAGLADLEAPQQINLSSVFLLLLLLKLILQVLAPGTGWKGKAIMKGKYSWLKKSPTSCLDDLTIYCKCSCTITASYCCHVQSHNAGACWKQPGFDSCHLVQGFFNQQYENNMKTIPFWRPTLLSAEPFLKTCLEFWDLQVQACHPVP